MARLLRLPFALGRVAGRLRRCVLLYPGGKFLVEATLAPGRTTAVATRPFVSLRGGGLGIARIAGRSTAAFPVRHRYVGLREPPSGASSPSHKCRDSRGGKVWEVVR